MHRKCVNAAKIVCVTIQSVDVYFMFILSFTAREILMEVSKYGHLKPFSSTYKLVMHVPTVYLPYLTQPGITN